jgi:anionic cell wall polymer biosynthesis LytR-Cps2A-Psr (LCP) family protein
MYAIFNLNSFAALIDDLGGINVTVLENVREYCPDIPPGVVLMRGEQALCYMRLRLGEEETARNRRQQEVLRTVFLRLVEGGNLVRVPELYERYRSSLDSNLTLDEIMGALPLALKLGDPSRIGFFQMDEDHLRTWQISKDPDAVVFLPNRAAVMRLMQQAIDYVSTPSPLSEVVVTLEYELTISPTPTATFTSTPSPTRTPSPLPTLTFTRTITPTPRPTITRTPTYTVTFTPRPTWSQTPSRAAP